MKDYEVYCFDSKHRRIFEDEMAKEVQDLILSLTEQVHDDNNVYNRFNSFIPIFDSDGYIEKYYLIFNSDEPTYNVKFVVNKREFEETYTKDKVEILLLSNRFVLENTQYLIKNKIFDIENNEITLECEL